VESEIMTPPHYFIVNNILNYIVALVHLFVKSKNWKVVQKYNGVFPGDKESRFYPYFNRNC